MTRGPDAIGNRIKKGSRSLIFLGLAAGSLGIGGCSSTNDTGITFSNAPTQTPATALTSTQETATANTSSGGSGTGTGNPNVPTPFAGGGVTTDFPLSPGQCINLDGGNTYIAEGDLLVGPDQSNVTKPYDDLAPTGTEYLIEGDQPTTVCANFGGDIHQMSPNQEAIATEENSVYVGLRRSGCGTGDGCTGGVQFVTVDSGQVQSVILHTGNNF